jgi:hypothetical protein
MFFSWEIQNQSLVIKWGILPCQFGKWIWNFYLVEHIKNFKNQANNPENLFLSLMHRFSFGMNAVSVR